MGKASNAANPGKTNKFKGKTPAPLFEGPGALIHDRRRPVPVAEGAWKRLCLFAPELKTGFQYSPFGRLEEKQETGEKQRSEIAVPAVKPRLPILNPTNKFGILRFPICNVFISG